MQEEKDNYPKGENTENDADKIQTCGTFRQRLVCIDGIKGIAACIVAFIWHYQHFGITGEAQPFYRIFNWSYDYGWLMVELFFMLSGFGMMMGYSDSIRNKEISFFSFISRRLRRIYPLHIITLLAVTLFEALYLARTGETFVYKHYDAFHFILNALCLQTGLFEKEYSFNGPGWCISVMVMLYVLFYLVMYCSKNRKQTYITFGALALLGLVLIINGTNYTSGLNLSTARGLVCFSTGVFLFRIYEERKRIRFERIGILFLFAAAVFVVLTRVTDDSCIGNIQLVFTLAIAPMIILGVLFWHKAEALLSLKPFAYLGKISMSVYLLHFPVQCIIMILNEYLGLHLNFASSTMWTIFVVSVLFAASVYEQILSKQSKHEPGILRYTKMALIGGTAFGIVFIFNSFGIFDRLLYYGMLDTRQDITGELNMTISADELTEEAGTVSGSVMIINNGKSVLKLSDGEHPVNLGVKLCDNNGIVLNQDYQHIPIRNGNIGIDKSVEVKVSVPLQNEENQLQFELVQEGIAWIPDTKVCW